MGVRSNRDMLLIECVVKGYHECGFTVMASETFFLEKKIAAVARPSMWTVRKRKMDNSDENQ